jgi:hypothetical protein
MKRVILLGACAAALAGCAGQQSAPPATTGPQTPTSYAAGSAANTTGAFDGTYIGTSIINKSSGSALPGAGEGSSSCHNYPTPPPVTIAHGLGQLDVLNLRFQGYVAPQGALAMRSGVGQRFEGQIDPQFVLRGRVIGACVYDASWRRSG